MRKNCYVIRVIVCVIHGKQILENDRKLIGHVGQVKKSTKGQMMLDLILASSSA